MRQNPTVSLLALIGTILLAGPSLAQNVAFSGKLQIGFSDQDNVVPTMLRTNNAIPICAGYPAANPASTKPAGTTLGTLIVNARGNQVGSGVGAALTFNAVGATSGGAQEFDNETCNVSIPGFANPRLRSRTQVGAAHWPARRGPFQPGSVFTNTTESGATEMVPYVDFTPPATPTATYMVSAGNGNVITSPIPFNINLTQTRINNFTNTFTLPTPTSMGATTSTTMSTTMQTTVFNINGTGGVATIPFLGTGGGFQIIEPAGGFGGGVPFTGMGGVQLGVNFATIGPTGMTLGLGDYGQVSYANGFLRTDPLMGTDAKGISILNPALGYVPPTFTPTLALVQGRQDLEYAARTPGGTTQFDQGAIRTLGGGNTRTPMGNFEFTTMGTMGTTIELSIDCANMTIPGLGGVPGTCPAIISPVAFSGQFGEWTTGKVRHVDQAGDFVTIRSATGFDQAVTPGSAIAGETRRLQLVSPWSASIKPVGPFGLGVLLPALSFGGVAIANLNVIPVPEPSTLAMLGFGIAGLAGLGIARRRNSRND